MKIYPIVLTTWFVLCLSAVSIGLYLGHSPKDTTHIPEFKSRQCFVKAGLREVWDKPVEGIVWRVGYLKYIVMYASEADRKYTGPKDGWEEDILTFDEKFQRTPCPAEWKLTAK